MVQVQLIPFKVQQAFAKTNEIPTAIKMMRAPKKWKEGYTGRGVVGVIDTGCDRKHPDLKNRIIGGRNFSSENKSNFLDFNDQNGHGTHVAGTIAATVNGLGVSGVAPHAQVFVLKAFDAKGYGETESIINAIHYAIRWRGNNGEKIRVLSISFGSKENHPKLHQAVRKAVANDMLVVCAAGNDGDDNIHTTERLYPGHYQEVVQVGAVDHKGNMAPFTNSNDEIDLVAPGVDVRSTYLNGKYASLSGTSMATPHVAGAAAIMIEQLEKELGRTLTEPELYTQLIQSTVSLKHSKRAQGNGFILFS
ncbi:S8 family peptidase [Aquibacillus koreensis]|uniref:S8 family peptidase n=1 Tax=Aquibacillus koreensis TaxID=279446 RepID=A0A9X3WGS2_9BACI|nr:S8 family peptidase [Aquibacillus koreensis]MCT2536446.1 S8 family peptidase [Aquibacillus koreensis]MDC3419465.1 S8 family peptidase [Aquibacillus koreensis]